jgi:carbonic anhydrase/acetyltransferase-like protein (isoleucine patch superfamily)
MGTETYRPYREGARRVPARRRRYRRPVPIYALGDAIPDIHPDAFVHPDAVVIGAVRIGAESTVWPNAVLRGDGGGRIEIGDRTSVQDGTVVHTTPEHPTIVGSDCVVGHIVHLEGCTIEDGVLIGSGSIVLHGVVVHTGAIVAANAVVLDGTDVPPGALAVGTPATIKPGRARPDEITHGRDVYVEKGRQYREHLRRIG